MNYQRITQLRESLGLSQSELARGAGLDQSIVSRVESGKLQPSLHFLARCGEVLQLSAEEQQLLARSERRRQSPTGLRDRLPWLRRVFEVPASIQVPPLRVAFALARSSPLGSKMVEKLDLRKRGAAQWTAIKALPGQMNTPEQLFALHGLLQGGIVQEFGAHETGFPLPVVRPHDHWELALVVGQCLYFPQLTLGLKSYMPRLDFLVAVACKPSQLYVNLEIDGPGHKGMWRQDGERAASIGLPTLRIPHWRLEREDFWPWYEGELEKVVRGCGRTIRRGRGGHE